MLKSDRHNDRLYGKNGNDTLAGCKGNDSHNCGPARDDIANGGNGTDMETNCENTSQIPR